MSQLIPYKFPSTTTTTTTTGHEQHNTMQQSLQLNCVRAHELLTNRLWYLLDSTVVLQLYVGMWWLLIYHDTMEPALAFCRVESGRIELSR